MTAELSNIKKWNPLGFVGVRSGCFIRAYSVPYPTELAETSLLQSWFHSLLVLNTPLREITELNWYIHVIMFYYYIKLLVLIYHSNIFRYDNLCSEADATLYISHCHTMTYLIVLLFHWYTYITVESILLLYLSCSISSSFPWEHQAERRSNDCHMVIRWTEYAT